MSRFSRRARPPLAISGQKRGLVSLGADGRVLSPVKLWCDTATVNECKEISNNFGGQQFPIGDAVLVQHIAVPIFKSRVNEGIMTAIHVPIENRAQGVGIGNVDGGRSLAG